MKDYCNETCALEQCRPVSVIIQIIDAELTVDYLSYETQPKENPAESRYQAKRAKDAEKIEVMNERIPEFQMNWTSGDNSLVATYYDQKRNMFGDGYNLLGYDYYTGGVFEFLGHRDYPKVDPNLVWHFDWRERHGANDSLSPYYDGDTLGTGWLTSVKCQLPHKTCWAFSSVGQTEAMANLYDNDPYVGYYDENYNCTCIIEMDTTVHYITSDTTWADSMLVNYTINIDSGACLTISSYVEFAPEARFIVNRGGKLIIDGGHLTKACPELWKGIEVFGRDTSQLLENYFGVVIVKNEAVIENAKKCKAKRKSSCS